MSDERTISAEQDRIAQEALGDRLRLRESLRTLREAAQQLIRSRTGGNLYKDRLGETLVSTDAFDALAAAIRATQGDPDAG